MQKMQQNDLIEIRIEVYATAAYRISQMCYIKHLDRRFASLLVLYIDHWFFIWLSFFLVNFVKKKQHKNDFTLKYLMSFLQYECHIM